MPALDALLRLAATNPDWETVIHRCAWCGRIRTERGAWVFRPVDASAVTTDGMCPSCGTRALSEVGNRQLRRLRRAA
jgi:hypothetical protein